MKNIKNTKEFRISNSLKKRLKQMESDRRNVTYTNYEKKKFDADIWNLDITLRNYIYPRLEYFRNKLDTNEWPSFPSTFKSMEEWKKTLDKMLNAFQLLDTIGINDLTALEKEYVDKGLCLFAKHFTNLWE